MATQSTPHSSSLRQRLKHKTSFSLPTIQSADFTDVRRSFEDSRGIDLPPIPVGMSREPRHLTPVTERDESNESHLMRRTLDEMGPALAALDKSQSSATTGSSRMAWSDLAPTVLHGETIGMTSLASFGTEDEEMSEEMERVMAMDTPTRSEFVISRPTTSAGSCLGHRTSGSGKALPPLPTVEHKYGSTTPGSTTTGNSQSGSSIPAVQNFRYSTFAEPVTSHPHPPPLQPSQTTIAPDLIAIAAPHPPLQGLATKNSSETVRSDMTATTTTSTASPTPTPEFRLSRQELLLVQQLRSRRSQSAMAVHQDRGNSSKAVHQDPVCNSLAVGQDKEKEETGQRKGLRPLQLVGDRNTNRMSAPLPMVGEKRYDNKAGPAGPKLSNETRAKMSAASRTGKGSKASHGSGVSGIRI